MRPALLLACCLLLPAAVAAQGQPSCDSAQADLEKFLGAFSRSCRQDSDCEGYYYRANACAGAVVVRKHKLAGKRRQRLLALQQSAREACNVYYRIRPACSPIPFRAACRRHACVDARATPPEGEPTGKPPAAYPYATIRHACAPWDGPALQITLTKVENSGKNDARLFLTLYRDLPEPPLTKPRTFELERMESGDAVRCPRPNACESATSGRVVLEQFDGTSAEGSYELHFKDGSIERGRFKALWKEVREACG
ncbi:MAG: hypothetical protein ACRD2K_02230 [Terriglobales bacterium]